MTQITYTSKVLPLFTASLFTATIGAFIGMQYFNTIANSGLMILLYIVEFVLLIAAMIAKRSKNVGGLLLFAFVFVSGLVISPVISLYVANDGAAIVFQALLITSIVFAALSYYAYVSGKNFSRLGGFLFTALIGLIIASLVNIFLQNGIVFLVVDVISIVVFSGFILYDTGRILNSMDDADVYSAVLSLYLDFLNLFLDILEFLGIFRRRD